MRLMCMYVMHARMHLCLCVCCMHCGCILIQQGCELVFAVRLWIVFRVCMFAVGAVPICSALHQEGAALV